MSQTKAQLIDNLVQPITGAAGSASAPTFSFTADPNTGIYSPGADQLAISTNGTRRLQVNSDGTLNVFGVNKTASGGGNSIIYATDTQAVDVGGSIGFGGYYIGTSSDTEWAQIAGRKENSTSGNYAGYLQFSTRVNGGSTSEKMRLTSDGKLGLGNSLPSYRLDVKSPGNGQFFINGQNSAGTNIFQVYESSTGDGQNGMVYLYDGAGNNDVKISTNGASWFNGGNVGIGDNSPGRLFSVKGSASGNLDAAYIQNSRDDGSSDSVSINLGLARTGGLVFEAVKIKAVKEQAFTGTPSTIDASLTFETIQDENLTERMRITSAGNVLFGGLTNPALTNDGASYIYDAQGGKIRIVNSGNGNHCLDLNSRYGSGTQYPVRISFASSQVGSISCTSTATAYNTSSDYRLKENVTVVTDGIVRLQQLKPSRFNFIADPGKVVDGFLAHEVQAVVPEAISGEKDAVDDDGSPVYQGIDQSKLVPLLTAALQEAVAKIESLEARLTAAGI